NTAEAIYYALRGTWRTIDGMDLLFRQRKISYLLTTWQGKNTAQRGQQKGSIIYQDVVSHDNSYLEKIGLYDPKTDTLDEEGLKA
ncbi:relaxase MobL, partial [Enterococcus faecium]|uniref:relaxase MobL n=1 Tax=Enterococcus faecium TaxID=1352 RepID=UPI00292D302F